MRVWEKIGYGATAVSALAALIGAGFAIKQSTSTAGDVKIAMENMVNSMKFIESDYLLEQDAQNLRQVFASSEWKPMTIQDLWDLPEVKAIATTQDKLISAMMKAEQMRLVRTACIIESDQPEFGPCDKYAFVWDDYWQLAPE